MNQKYQKIRDRDLKNISAKLNSNSYESSIRILKEMTKSKPQNIVDCIEKNNNDTVVYDYYKTKIEKYIKKTDKRELVYIGRGSVKVGYNLEDIDSTNIFFSPNKDTMYIFDLNPEITDLDINPYFYYPSNNKNEDTTYFGFQIIYSKKEDHFTLREVNNVKSQCKLLLRQEALKRDIYTLAHKNAELALTNFLGLMKTNDGKGIQCVLISHSKYFKYQTQCLYDMRIDSTETRLIEEIVHEDLDRIDPINFMYQDHSYQLKHLDKFMLDLHQQSQGKNNATQWDSLYLSYTLARE